MTTAEFDRTYRVNVYATFWLCRAAVPHLPPGAAIINTSSQNAYRPDPILLDYASTRAAINTFSKGLAQQLAPQGMRVNVVAPGPVRTPLQVAGVQPPEELPEFGAETPPGRSGQRAEMAPADVFLASQESSYLIGATIAADGGLPIP